MKVLFMPVNVVAGLLAGLAGKKVFQRLWGLIDDEEPPRPEQRELSWPKLLAALAAEGAIFRLVKGLAITASGACSPREPAPGPARRNQRLSEHAAWDLPQRPSRRLDVRVDRLKVLGGWTLEKVARLKPNGELLGYSPLSRLLELEGLTLGVRGKLALWRALSEIQTEQPALAAADLTALEDRAERQLSRLERSCREAAVEALSA